MGELLGLAFLFCARAEEKGMKRDEIIWLVECQLDHLETIEFLKRLEGVEWIGRERLKSRAGEEDIRLAGGDTERPHDDPDERGVG